MKKLKVEIESKYDMERFILISIIGLFDSLEEKLLTIEDSERAIFTPATVDLLKKHNLNKQIVEIVECGCELENIESLLPEKLDLEIVSLKTKSKELLKELLKKERSYERWLVS